MSAPVQLECYGRPDPGPPDPAWWPYVNAALLPVCGVVALGCLAGLAWIAVIVGSTAGLVLIGVETLLMTICAVRIAQTRPWTIEGPDVVPKQRTVVQNSEVS